QQFGTVGRHGDVMPLPVVGAGYPEQPWLTRIEVVGEDDLVGILQETPTASRRANEPNEVAGVGLAREREGNLHRGLDAVTAVRLCLHRRNRDGVPLNLASLELGAVGIRTG